jgi:hypothetical protein
LTGMRPGSPGWGTDDDDLLVYDDQGQEHCVPTIAGDQRLYYVAIEAALRGIAPNPVPGIQALATMAVIEAANESAMLRSAVTLPLTALERNAWSVLRRAQ